MLYLVLFHFFIYLLVFFYLLVKENGDFIELKGKIWDEKANKVNLTYTILQIIVLVREPVYLLVDFDELLLLFDAALLGGLAILYQSVARTKN